MSDAATHEVCEAVLQVATGAGWLIALALMVVGFWLTTRSGE